MSRPRLLLLQLSLRQQQRLLSKSKTRPPALPFSKRRQPRPPVSKASEPEDTKEPSTIDVNAVTPGAKQPPEGRDLDRATEAARRYVREGKIDPKYKGASRKVLALICALPVLIATSYELFRRRFLGVEQKKQIVLVDNGQTVEE